MFGTRTSFEKLLEKATSQLLLEPDWDSILQISDCIRQGDVNPKHAVNSIKKKIGTENPHVSLFALQVLESCMKNCGSAVHDEVATKEFMEFLNNLVHARGQPIKEKILELIQVWSHAFRNESHYKIVQDTFNLMKLEGQNFPQLKESDAMFSAEKAPEWKDAECCSRCRTVFSMVQRKHHCRACGDVVCQKCSMKSSIIPKYGIEREVRVCDQCYDKINKGSKSDDEQLPAEYLNSSLAKQPQVPTPKSEAEIQEEEELQLALALSQSEEENKAKERERLRNTYGIYGGVAKETTQSVLPTPQPQQTTVTVPMIDTSDMDPELARYLNRNYWQQKSESNKGVAVSTTTQPSAPVAQVEPRNVLAGKIQEAYQNGETDEDSQQFLHALNSSVEIFVNRIRSNSQRGRSIAVDSSVQSLFNVISNMHPQLMIFIQQQEDLRGHYELLQDKLAQLRDAREALDALREDHKEKRQREMEELERQRQIQMAQKLEIMRQKKHEYLEMQRQLALQRLQEQEREMQMRFEQQRQLTQMRQIQNYGGYNQPAYQQAPPHAVSQSGYSSGGGGGAMMEGSPVHNPHQQHIPHMPSYVQQMYVPSGSQGQYNQSAPGRQSNLYQGMPVISQEGTKLGYYSMTLTDGAANPIPHQQTTFQPSGTIHYNSDLSGTPSISQTMPIQLPGGNVGYSMVPAQMLDYQQGAYNMQGMANSLPQGDGQGYRNTQNQYLGGSAQQYQQGQGHGTYNPGLTQSTQGPASQSSSIPPQQQRPQEAELISFD